MRLRRRPLLIAGACALLVAGVAACAGDEPDGPSVRLHATAEQWRNNEVNRELAVALHNDTGVPVWVSRVDPVLPSFEGESGADTNTLLPASTLRVDIPVKFGAGACIPAAAASHVVVVARPEGATKWQRITVPLPDPNPLLDRLLAIDCATQRVQQSVTLRFGPWTDLGRDGVRGSILIDRTAAATTDVRIREVDGNIMYRFAFAGATPLATVTAAAPHAEVRFTAQPQRCDLHAFAEIKKPFEFPVRVSLGAAEPLTTTIPVDADDRRALDTMLRRNCGLPPA
ncbi:hypothetical protein Asp14428_44820 [Actinoplanes sp. NBRC 14428]|nr:hypothetical protein Asp14428_44820 [Actinoplanes sp. NBRC 14428]